MAFDKDEMVLDSSGDGEPRSGELCSGPNKKEV
jgi:hypothetical protein